MHFKLIIGLILSSALIAGCSPMLYVPVPADSGRMGISLETLVRGRNLYVQNCAGCHRLNLPERFTPSEWKINLEKMKSKAKITDEQKESILTYLTSKSVK